MTKKPDLQNFTVKADKNIGNPMILIGDKAAYVLDEFQQKNAMEQLALIMNVASQFQDLKEKMTVVTLKSLIDVMSEENEDDDEKEGALH